MYFVYILKSLKTGHYYVGYTNNMARRMAEHNGGKTPSLRRHIPLEIVKIEVYSFYGEARERERQIKKYKSGTAFRRVLGSLPPPSGGV
ncbi:MAG: GIY-YIG nuclease family protein [Patescibacteria group bacterium]